MVVDRPDSDEMIDYSVESTSDENQGSMLRIVDCAVVRLTDEVRVRTSLSNTTSDDDDDDDNSSTSDNTTSNETVTQPSTASSISSFCQNISTHSTSSNLTRILIRPINLTQELNSSTISLTYTTDSVIINQLTRSTGSRSNQSCSSDSLLSEKFEPILDQDDSETDDYNELQLFKFSYQNIINCSTKPTDPRHCLNDPIIFKFSAITSTHPTRSKTFNLIGHLIHDSHHQSSYTHLERWQNSVLTRAYRIVNSAERSVNNHLRNILLIINPYGGSKKAEKIYRTVVEPILKLSDSKVQTIYTDRSGHAVQIGKEFDAEKFDVVGCVSGDGTVHELINGIGLRKDATRVFKKISISCIPAGSGNALSVNQMGPENGKNPVLATLTLLKGKPLPLDLCSVTQLSQDNQTVERSLSFLSTAFGLMADLDIGTERLRWMGDTRFLLGYIWGALKNQKRSVRLEVQVLDEQKESIHQNWKNFRDQKSDSDGNDVCNNEVGQSGMEKEDEGEGLPELVFGDVLRPVSKGWKTIETDVTSIYAGTLPFMSCDLLEFPVKVQGDGSIDVIIHRSPNWIRTMKCVIGSHVGSMFRNEDCDYLKTRAFRLTPLRKDSTGLTSDIPVSSSTKQRSKMDQRVSDESHRSELKPLKRTKKAQRSNNSCIDENSDYEEDEQGQDAGCSKGGEKGQDGKSYIVVDGEEMEYRTLQVEIHNRLARVLSLDCQKLGSIGVPDSIM